MTNVEALDGRFSEAFGGTSPDGVHINLVVGRRGGTTAGAAAATLANPSAGHTPFLACLRLGTAVRPATVVTNKTTIEDDLLGRLTWGAAQLGLAQAVLDSVADGSIDPTLVDDLVLLVALWLDTAATDETAVKAAAREAMGLAIRRAINPNHDIELEALVADRENAANGFYSGN